MKRHRRPSLPRLLLGCWIGLLLAAAPATGALAAPDAEVHGTGFGVARGPQGTVILTAFHVVRDALQGRRTITVGTGTGGTGTPIAWHPATLLASDEASDLALLSTTAELAPLPLARWAEVPVGDELFAIGYPMPELLGWTPKITDGLLNGLAPGAAGEELFQFSAAIHHGSSGSPLLRADGTVAGMVQAMIAPDRFRKLSRQTPQLLNYAVNVGVIARFLDRAGIALPSPTPPPAPPPAPPGAEGPGRDAGPATPSALFARARASVVAVKLAR